MSLIKNLVYILTLDCRESSRLLSESLDRDLRWSERVAIRMHYIGCWSCRRLKQQFLLLREAARQFDAQTSSAQLREEAKNRMRAALRETQT